MKFTAKADSTTFHLELTRRNLEGLLAKLDDPHSAATLTKTDEQEEGWYSHIHVKAVENEEHYADRPAGVMYMPSTGEYL